MRTSRPDRVALLATGLALAACSSGDPDRAAPDAGPADAGATDAAPPGDASAQAQPPAEPVTPPKPVEEARCPPEMVRVARRYCVDRYEATLLDAATGSQISPYYPPSRRAASSIEKNWQKLRFDMGNEEAQKIDLPVLPDWQQKRDFEPRAVSKKGVTPQGYTSGELAALACKNAGKRLCSLDEWRTACMGEEQQQFPYGPKYEQGRCNVFRESHPALVLHDDMTKGHSDPRLNRVVVNGRPLLRRTGETATCMSRWEDDAIADMVGNLDEWVADEEGTFAGGFFSRSSKEGCKATVTAHTFDYFDYSTGVRCCMDLPPPGGGSAPQ